MANKKVERPIPASAKRPVAFVMPKFIPDREPEEPAHVVAARAPSWRAPDEALPTPRQMKTTEDEGWIEQLPEKMYEQ